MSRVFLNNHQENFIIMASVVIGLVNTNTAGVTVGDVIVYSIAGLASYLVTDYVIPNESATESKITKTFKKIPVIGTIWSVTEDVDTITKAITSMSFVVGLVAGMLGKVISSDGGVGLLCALGAGSIEALIVNGSLKKALKKIKL